MAGFGDSNDIKISVTVDTEPATNAAKEIGKAFADIAKDIGVDFKTIAQAAKQFSAVKVEQVKKDAAEEVAKIRATSAERLATISKDVAAFKEGEITKRTQLEATSDAEIQKLRTVSNVFKQSQVTKRTELQAAHKEELQKLRDAAAATAQAEAAKRTLLKNSYSETITRLRNEARDARQAANQKIAAMKTQTDAEKAEASKQVRIFKETEATKRLEIKKTIEEVRLAAAQVRQATVAMQSQGAGKAGAMGEGLGINLPNLAAGVYLAKEAIGVIQSLTSSVFQLAEAGNRAQALSTAFQTLQQSVGRDPSASIERLRTATQGLISDTELYQKANQAVLLGVPTKLFEESAEAAVKLGRAMGIDATLALESLSIGLGRQSRLYLDNLGIVVSATEAYSNFARENNKLVDDLTDAEKRIAFFNETSKKLKEGLETLPPLGRDAGIAFTELTATQENLATAFLLGFNNSVELERGLTKLNEASKGLEEPLKRAGEALASFLGRIVTADYIPVIDEMALGLRFLATQAASAADNFFNLSDQAKRTELDNLAKKIANVQDQLRVTKSPLAVKELQASLAIYEAEAKALEEVLAESVRRAQERASFTIKAKVDTTEVKNALLETESLLAQYKIKTEEGLGLIRIPGLNTTQIDALIPEVDNLFRKIEEGGQSAQASAEQVNQLMQAIADEINATNIETVQGQLAKLRSEEAFSLAQSIESSRALTAEEKAIAEARAVSIANLEAQLVLLQQGLALDQKQREQIEKFFEYRKKLVQSDVKETISQGKKNQTEAKRVLDQQKRQIDDFVKSVRKTTKTAIDPKFERQLAKLFRGVSADSQEFEDGLRDIAKAIIKSNGDLSAYSKTIKAWQNLLKQGVPKNQLPLSADAAEAAAAYNEELEKAQEGMINLRNIFKGPAGFKDAKLEGGAFFGFDIEGTTTDAEAALAAQVQDSLSTAFQAGVDGFSKEDAPALGSAVGAAIGAAFGATGGPTGVALGASIGSSLGGVIGSFIASSSTGAIEELDAYFEELFNPGRIAFVVNRQIEDAAGNITTEPIVNALRSPLDINFFDLIRINTATEPGESVFAGLSAELKQEFTSVAVALGTLSDLSYEQSVMIAKVLAENVGGTLNNLQVIIQATGKSFEDFANKIYEAFLNAAIPIEEAYQSLIRLGSYFEEGIPGAVGAYQEAITNATESFSVGGRQLIDSLRDIGSEGAEAGKSFEEVIAAFGESMNFNADKMQLLFASLKYLGINTLEDLAKAGTNVLLTFAEQLRRINQGVATTISDVQIPVAPNVTPPKTGGGGAKREDPAKELLKKQKEEARKLTQESQKYLEVIKQINAGQLTNVAAGAEIKKINADILKDIKRRDDIEKALNAELDRGAKGSKKRIGELSKELATVEERLKKVTEKAAEQKREYKDLDISGIIPLIKSQNTLGNVARQIGVSLEKNVDILVKGFLQGRLSIKQVNDEIKKTKDLLGPGIPGAVGAVTDAFQNLIDAGTQGGSFSADAFTDIFAEFREKFNKEGSAFREAQRQQLNANLDAAREAARTAVGPEASKAALEAVKTAQKALEDFRNTPLVPDLSDLREELKKSFNPQDVEIFFRALDESGLSSFEQLEGASSEAIVGILGRLEELGFKFNQTSGEIQGINQGLVGAETAANAGLDPLKEAIDLVKSFNDSAGLLPPAFNSTSEAIGGMNGPLEGIAVKISDTIELLGKLGGNTFTNEIVFDIKTTGAQGGEALVNLVFGDGSGASTNTGNGNTTPPTTTTTTPTTTEKAYTAKDFKYLSPGLYRNLRTKKKVTQSERNKLLGRK